LVAVTIFAGIRFRTTTAIRTRGVIGITTAIVIAGRVMAAAEMEGGRRTRVPVVAQAAGLLPGSRRHAVVLVITNRGVV
jgi:hypothetical protein